MHATRMEMLAVVFSLGLLVNSALCQINPAMLAMGMGGGMGGLPMGLMAGGGEMGGNMQDMMLMQQLARSGGGGGGSGIDPMTMMMLTGAGGAGGAAGGNDMVQMMMMMNLMNQNNQQQQPEQQQQQQQQEANQPQQVGGHPVGQPEHGAQQPPSIATNIANLLAAGQMPSSEVSVAQHNALWGVVQMTGNGQRVMDAITTPADKIQLERDGLPAVNPMMTMAMCPRPSACRFAFCENTEIPYTPESFYVCRGCPRCRLDPGQQNIMNMMNTLGAGGGGNNMAQTMLMMRAMNGGAGGAAAGGAGGMNPAMMMALMQAQQQQQQEQQQQQQQQQMYQQRQQVQASPSTGRSAVATNNLSRPPPEFIAAMKAIGTQMAAKKGKAKPKKTTKRPQKPPVEAAK